MSKAKAKAKAATAPAAEKKAAPAACSCHLGSEKPCEYCASLPSSIAAALAGVSSKPGEVEVEGVAFKEGAMRALFNNKQTRV